MKKLLSLILAVCLVAPLIAGPGSRGSSASSSSRSSGGSWGGGFSKPSSPAPSASRPSSNPSPQAQPAKSGGWGFFGGGNKAATPTAPAAKPAPTPAMARQAFTEQQKAQSRAAFQEYKQPARPVQRQEYASSPVYTRVVTSGPQVTYHVYHENRVNFYRGYNPPIYVSYGRPSYGMYDAMFMWMMLDRINDDNYRRMYYNHYGDPAFREWRNEADRLAQDNAELRAKLNQMDTEVKQLQGQPQDPNYVPAGVDPSVMISDDVAKQTYAQAEVQASPVKNDGFADEGIGGWGWFFIFAGVGLAGFAVYKFTTRKPANPYGRYGI